MRTYISVSVSLSFPCSLCLTFSGTGFSVEPRPPPPPLTSSPSFGKGHNSCQSCAAKEHLSYLQSPLCVASCWVGFETTAVSQVVIFALGLWKIYSAKCLAAPETVRVEAAELTLEIKRGHTKWTG
ncbi:hypothetical protein BDZ97DRAFT_596591 [Flammula alnicola]|nr:hypothetical protein BDZ97DRAFT_596591 [Flammula alnicola]